LAGHKDLRTTLRHLHLSRARGPRPSASSTGGALEGRGRASL